MKNQTDDIVNVDEDRIRFLSHLRFRTKALREEGFNQEERRDKIKRELRDQKIADRFEGVAENVSRLSELAFDGGIVLSPLGVPISIAATESFLRGTGLYLAGLTATYLSIKFTSWLSGHDGNSPFLWSPYNITSTPIHEAVISVDKKYFK